MICPETAAVKVEVQVVPLPTAAVVLTKTDTLVSLRHHPNSDSIPAPACCGVSRGLASLPPALLLHPWPS